ncbi:hypothetical protein BN1048_01698 [Jeotgalicoccus saudimassiliensis]|uniref:Uncharacterized protein n=1 Tax=Jeotgalicoccus saudimassiliensis TaxID=1461582 RepID=A0A078M7X2_9STAP|nr:hypothetical protein BN1048_01698 [Jeotgalicoccus saudimassiliensis]
MNYFEEIEPAVSNDFSTDSYSSESSASESSVSSD